MVTPAPPLPRADRRFLWGSTLLLTPLIAFLGWLCIVGPVFAKGVKLMPAPLSPLTRTGIEKLSPAALGLLALLGFVAGLATRVPTPVIGAAAVVSLPVVAIAEMVVDATSHNLIPLELMMYAMLGAGVLVAALAGRGVRMLVLRLRERVVSRDV